MTKKQCVYVKSNSYDLWWGVYGLSSLTGWEDIVLFDGPDIDANKLGYTCVCTKNYLGNGLEDLEEDPEQEDFVKEIKEYLQDNKIHYHYSYDDPSKEDFYQLPYINLPPNEKGVMPRYIEMWHPNDGIDLIVIEECIIDFCKKFLDIDVIKVKFIEPISIEDAIISYSEHLQLVNGNIEFSEDLIQDLMKEFSKKEQDVFKILKDSIT